MSCPQLFYKEPRERLLFYFISFIMQRTWNLAQINIGRMIGVNIDDPIMKTFADRLEEVNALAEGSKGFVWRLKDESNNATHLNPYGDDRIIVNLSVWETMDDLMEFVFKGKHSEVLRKRKDWFENFGKPYTCFWYVRAGQVPSVQEAVQRLDHLQKNGPSEHAFDFKTRYPEPV
jgi:hypothetical protein